MRSLKMKYIAFPALFALLASAALAADETALKNFFAKNKVGSSPDYAVVKNGVAGPEVLVVVVGYMDDKSVCESLIKEYNKDSSMSVLPGTYKCVPLNK